MALAVIPSRFHSTRFDGKALAQVGGEPLVARVARRVLQADVFSQVVVATDDRRIAQAVEHLDVAVHLDTGRAFACGTDRVAAAAQAYPHARVVNVQGDEAMVTRDVLTAALAALEGSDMGTVATAAETTPGRLAHGDVVKVAVDAGQGRALDFSRGPLPGARLIHLGVYAFWRHSLERFASLAQSPRELDEGLEQLRALQAGMTIGVRQVQAAHLGINRPADLAALQQQLQGVQQERFPARKSELSHMEKNVG